MVSSWPWLLVLLLLVGRESSGEISKPVAAAGANGCEQGGRRRKTRERVQFGRSRQGGFPEVSEADHFVLPSGKWFRTFLLRLFTYWLRL